MLDSVDVTESPLRLILFKALRSYDDRQLLAWLEDRDPILRTAAARELQMRSGDQVFEHIKTLCRSSRHETREAAAFALGQLGTPACPYAEASFDLLSDLLRDEYYEVRSQAIAAIGQLATLGHQPKSGLKKRLLEFAADPEPAIRVAVAYSLLSLRDRRIDAVIQRLLDDEDATVRDAAVFTLQARSELRALERDTVA